jgi:hypothetical protein
MSPEIALLTAIDRYLGRLEPGNAGIQESRARLATFLDMQTSIRAAGASAPKCGY